MKGVTISGTQNGNGTGVVINGGSAWVEACQIVNNVGGGIFLDNGGGLSVTNSTVGGDLNSIDAIEVADGSATILYSTLFGGGDFGGGATALRCMDGTDVTVRNSLLVATAAGDEIICEGAQIEDNALEMSIPNNVQIGPIEDYSWFIDAPNGDFHLSGTHPDAINTAATWQPGDPSTDIDGDPRPSEAGAADVAGADIP